MTFQRQQSTRGHTRVPVLRHTEQPVSHFIVDLSTISSELIEHGSMPYLRLSLRYRRRGPTISSGIIKPGNSECGGMRCKLQKRVVGLIVDPRGSLLLPAIVSFLSFLTNWCPALAPCLRIMRRDETFHSSRNVLTHIFPARTRRLNIPQVLLSNNS